MGLSHTVSGDIASFRTPSKVPIESLKFHFLPKQAAGTPSPENPIPIEGWTGLNGRRAGKNLIEPHYGVETVQRDITITPSTNGISVSGTASARTAILLSKADKNTKLGVGDKVTFSLYLNGDISECESPFLGYYKSRGVWGGVIGQISSENNRKITWTVPNTYTDDSILDSYIYVPQGVTVNFEIGLQMEAGSNATNYEPYSEEQIPITFPSNGKNLLNDETTVPRNTSMSKNNHTYTNLIADTKNYIELYIQQFDTNGNVINTATSYWYNPAPTRKSITFDIKNGCRKLLFKHNGQVRDLGIYIPWDGRLGTYTISANFEGVDISTVGGFIFSDVQIELGDAMTSYEVYSSDNTFYGGYIDPVAGEIVAEYEMITDAWKNWTVRGEALGNKIKIHRFNNLVNSVSGGGGICISNVAKKMWKDTEESNPHFYITYATSTVPNYNSVHMFLPLDLDEDTIIQVLATLITPIHIPIPAQDLKAFLDHNNFWSDANDITEVTYAVTESKDILDARKLIMDGSQPHLEDASGTIASFNTDMKAPLKELKAYFTPVQEGSGDPSPQNERPIHGWTGLNIHDEGKNLINKNALDGTDKVWWKGGITTGFPDHCVTPLIPVKPGASYYLYRKSTSSSGQSGQGYVCYFGKGGRSEYIGQENWQDIGVGNPHVIPDNVYYIGITIGTDHKDTAYLQLNSLPRSYADYVEESIIPVQFPAMKNLLNIEDTYYINPGASGSTITIANGVISIDAIAGSARTYVVFNKIFPAGTYTIQAKNSGAASSAKLLADVEFDGSTFNSYYNMYTKQISTSTYTLTFTLPSASKIGLVMPNASGESGNPGSLYDIQVEFGSVATACEPFGVAYGGYVDIIRGKFIVEYKTHVFNGSERIDEYPGTFTNGIRLTSNALDDCTSLGNTTISDKAVLETIVPSEISRLGIRIGGGAFRFYFYIPDSMFDGGASIEKFKQWLAENKLTVVARLTTPIEYDLTPQQIKTLKGINNIWSNANGAIDVKYWTH